MSEITKCALYSALAGDTALAALLGTDENGDPAVFNAAMNRLPRGTTGWSYPCITFRQDSSPVDARFVGGMVGAEFFSLEVWWEGDSSIPGERILARLKTLLHNVTLSVTSGRVYCCEVVSTTPDQYDDRLKAHVALLRVKLVVAN